MVKATHQILIDKMDNSQAVLDSDDEMDDILNEFVKTENDIVQLSDDSSSDEMDSLLDEFAKTQSDSDTDEKKFDTKIVLLSDDDIEMEDILEEFREESIPDTSSLLSGKNDPTGSDITESKSVVSDTDNRNGTIFNNTFEIMLSEDSVDKSTDENVFNSPAKKPCLSSPKLQEFKFCGNLKQEQMDEDEKGNFSHDVKKDSSKSDLDSKVVTSLESIPCKKEFNINISEENISQNEVNSGSKINSVSNSCDKEPSLNNNASLCNNSDISVNSPINKTNFDTVNQCEKKCTELPQESEPSFSIKIASVLTVQNSEDNIEAVIEDSKQNLIGNLELEENATNASTFEKTADESILDKIKSLIQSLVHNAANAEGISMPIENGCNLTTENMDLCQAKEEITKCQKILNGEVSCTGIPTSRKESRKRWTKIRNSLGKHLSSRKMRSSQEHLEPQPKVLNPVTSSNHPTFINFPTKENMLVVPNCTPTSLTTISSEPLQVSKRMLEPSETSAMFKGYIEYKKIEQPVDHLTKYFQSVEETVRTFPIQLQIEAKKQISELMSQLEYKSFFMKNQTVHPPLYQYSQHPAMPHSVQHSNNLFFQSCEVYSYPGMDYSTPPND